MKESEMDHTCQMGHCRDICVSRKDICNRCYSRFGGELGAQMSEVVRLMIKRAVDRDKYPVDIVKADIYEIWPKDNKCPIMKTLFTIGGDLDTSPSLDRIDSNKGYVQGNIQVISGVANRMKSSANDIQLLKFAHFYINHYYEEYLGEIKRTEDGQS